MFSNILNNPLQLRLISKTNVPFHYYIQYLPSTNYWLGAKHKEYCVYNEHDEVIYKQCFENNILTTPCSEDSFFLYHPECSTSDLVKIRNDCLEIIHKVHFYVECCWDNVLCYRNQLYTIDGQKFLTFPGRWNGLNTCRDNLSFLSGGDVWHYKNASLHKVFTVNNWSYMDTSNTRFEYQPEFYTVITSTSTIINRKHKTPLVVNDQFVWDIRHGTRPISHNNKCLYSVHNDFTFCGDKAGLYLQKTNCDNYILSDFNHRDYPRLAFNEKLSTYDFFTTHTRYRYAM